MAWKSLTYTGWGRVLTATGRMARPERQSALADLRAPAVGNLRSYGDACLNDGGDAVDMTRLDRMLDFDPETGILEVEAGITIGTIAKRFANQGWLPSVMPGTGFATVGGCIANDVHGKNHHGVGTFGQHVVSIDLMVDGKIKRLTAKKNAGLFKATIGGLGQTGIISSARLQLHACQGDVITVTERRIEDFEAFINALDGSRSTYTVGWVDATATGDAMGRGILEEAETNYGLVPDAKRPRSVPFNAPKFALSAPIVRMFNKAYFNRVPSSGRTSVKPFTEFFFPLDKINAWNKLYGKGGFHQFQCVVPVDQKDALKTMLDKIAHAGIASPLAVLKRLGPGSAGLMSFPMDGYTLAVDFPNRGRAEHLIAELEAMTEAACGRIYLAKDATLTADRVKAMYPNAAKFASIANKIDPDGQFETDLTRRLKLRSAS
jgi:decaprenylphospho-beta-D-ribofuranose 2-oxidase